MKRVSFGLVSLTLGILVAARALDLVPDRDGAVIERRVAVCEALAVEASLAAQRSDAREVEAFARAVVRRHPDVVSVGVRDAEGRLLVTVGDHEDAWAGHAGPSTPTHMSAPILRGETRCGTAEVCYRPLPFGGWWRYVGGPLFPLLAFTGVVGFVATALYLRRTFRHVDPTRSGVVPERVRSALNTLVEGVLVLDRDERVVLANAEFARAVGLTPQELEGRKASELPWLTGGTEPAPEQYPWVRAVRDAAPQTGTILKLKAADRRRTVSVNSTPILGDDGACRGALATFDDLTPIQSRNARLRKLLKRLKRSREKVRSQARELDRAKRTAEAASKAKGEFLANVSHEIRTPMNAILGMTEAVLEGRLTDEQRECLDIVHASAGGLLGVINDLLDLSKIEAGKFQLDPTDFDLRSTVEDTLQTLALRAHKKGLELVCDMPAEVPEALVGDPVRVRQVVVNLVGNAIKFTEKGEVVLRVRVQERGADGVCLHFAVSDTGIGVPADKLRAIFEPFTQADGSTTRKYGGTGLGLTISSHLVELMGGTIWAESRVHRGSTFHFTARFGLSTRADTAVDLPALPAGHGLAAVVADDNATARAATADLLARLRLRPRPADGADAAVAEVERAAAAGERLPLVFIDAGGPGAGGFALAERLRGLPAAPPVVMLLASADLQRDIERCRRAGAPYIRKPVRLADLVRAIRKTLDPVAQPSGVCQTPEPRREAEPPGVVGLRVLLADDNPFNQRVAAFKLERLGHAVRVVGSGAAALAAIEGEEFDLLVTDVQMPDMDGFELTAAVRRREAATGRRLPVLAMTAHAMKGDRERCLAAGMDGYVPKPIEDASLREEIARVVPAGAGRPAAGPAAWDEDAVVARVGGDAGMLRQLLGVYREDSAALMATIRAAVAAGDAHKLKVAAHTLKGMAGFINAAGVVAQSLRLEKLAERADLAGAAAAAADLEREAEAVEAALAAYDAAAVQAAPRNPGPA